MFFSSHTVDLRENQEDLQHFLLPLLVIFGRSLIVISSSTICQESVSFLFTVNYCSVSNNIYIVVLYTILEVILLTQFYTVHIKPQKNFKKCSGIFLFQSCFSDKQLKITTVINKI